MSFSYLMNQFLGLLDKLQTDEKKTLKSCRADKQKLTFADILTDAMRFLNLSSRTVAEALRVNDSTILKWRIGQITPDPPTRQRVYVWLKERAVKYPPVWYGHYSSKSQEEEEE